MNRRQRSLSFDTLENIVSLSALPAAPAPAAHAMIAHRPPRFVRAVVALARRMGGTHITVTPTIGAPGSFTDYLVTFQLGQKTISTTVTIPVPPHPGPTPG